MREADAVTANENFLSLTGPLRHLAGIVLIISSQEDSGGHWHLNITKAICCPFLWWTLPQLNSRKLLRGPSWLRVSANRQHLVVATLGP